MAIFKSNLLDFRIGINTLGTLPFRFVFSVGSFLWIRHWCGRDTCSNQFAEWGYSRLADRTVSTAAWGSLFQYIERAWKE